MGKQTFINMLFLCMLLPCMMSCEQDPLNWESKLAYKNEFEKIYTPSAVTSLLSYANKETINLSITGNDTLKWKASALQKGSAMVVKYEVLLGSSDDSFSKTDDDLLDVITSDDSGIDTTLVINSSTLNTIASTAGIQVGQAGTICWKVRAYCGLNSSESTQTGHFILSKE